MSSNGSVEDKIEVIFQTEEEETSGEEVPMSEWSSLEVATMEENMKRSRAAQGLYSPGSGELCAKYIALSDSDVGRHVFYNYPAITDPGIESALLVPEKPVVYSDDGRDLYKALCKESDQCVVGMFYRNLLNEEISLSYYGVNPSSIRCMAIALNYNKHVKRFILTDNFLNDDACYHLGQTIATNNTLKELILKGCRIGASGMLRLGKGLVINNTLVTLDLARNCIEDEGGTYFAKYLDEGATVPRVNLSRNNLGRQCAVAMFETLQFRNKLTHLDLSSNSFFHTPSTVKLLEVLGQSKMLQELNLSRNLFEGERIAGALKGIIQIPALVVLDLSYNRFRDEAVRLIIAKLIKAKKMETLDLSFNPLTTTDAVAVIEIMLNPKVKLKNLYLDNVCVNKKFVTVLERVRKMKSRENFKIKYGDILENWIVTGPDPRDLILQRAEYLSKRNKKRQVDIALYFLRLAKELTMPNISNQELIDLIKVENIPLDKDLINELSLVFAGPKSAKTLTVDVQKIAEYIQRIWPDRKLPPTPPPEPEPEPEPMPPIEIEPKGKGKRKGKGKK